MTLDANVSITNLTVNFERQRAGVVRSLTFNWAGGSLDGNGTSRYRPARPARPANGKLPTGATCSTLAVATADNNLLGVDGNASNNSGTFNASGLFFFTGAGTFNNSGTFNVSAGTGNGVTVFANSSVLHNTGTVNIPTGAMELDSGGSSTGTFNANGAGHVDFDGGTMLFSGTPSLAGSGAYNLNAGALTFNGNVTPANLTMTSGTTSATGTLTVSNAFNWSGATSTARAR